MSYCDVYCTIPKSTLKSIKIYKCKLWHLLWEILAKTSIVQLSNFVWFIDLFMISFNQRDTLWDTIFFYYSLIDNSDYQSNTIHILYWLPIFPHLMGMAW